MDMCKLSEKIEKIKEKPKNKKWIALVAGCITGLVNGLFGGGGGMIVVPFLTGLLDCAPKKAHATEILIILPISIISGLFYLAFGSFNVGMGLPVGLGIVVGGGIGALLLSKLSSKWVTIIFSVVMAIAGVKMLLF